MNFVFYILSNAIMIYSYMLLVYILLSWFPGARETKFGEVLESLCEPFLEPFRKIIPPLGFIDLSPIVAFLVLKFAATGVQSLSTMF